MVHSLIFSQLADWWQDTVSITGEENDVARMSTKGWNFRIFDIFQRIGCSSILSELSVEVVDVAALSIETNVFQDCAELDSFIDIGLLFVGETNGLGIAATLNVEHSIFTPNVLVIANQLTMRISTQRSFTSSG